MPEIGARLKTSDSCTYVRARWQRRSGVRGFGWRTGDPESRIGRFPASKPSRNAIAGKQNNQPTMANSRSDRRESAALINAQKTRAAWPRVCRSDLLVSALRIAGPRASAIAILSSLVPSSLAICNQLIDRPRVVDVTVDLLFRSAGGCVCAGSFRNESARCVFGTNNTPCHTKHLCQVFTALLLRVRAGRPLPAPHTSNTTPNGGFERHSPNARATSGFSHGASASGGSSGHETQVDEKLKNA